jgi:hypothetical protein
MGDQFVSSEDELELHFLNAIRWNRLPRRRYRFDGPGPS